MNRESSATPTALARAWRAIVRAFSSTAGPRGVQQYGETTLFGASSEQQQSKRWAQAAKNEFWVPGESTDFAEFDAEGDSKRHR